MIETVQVARPPGRPVLIYDGECNFCCFWVRRWQALGGARFEVRPFQDPRVAEDFPELATARLEQAVHLVEPGGAVFSGAEAVFRVLALGRAQRWWLAIYRSFPGAALLSERSYEFVARHRVLFSRLTRILVGRNPEPASYERICWLFLRGLGLVYLVAFLSLWWQVDGLMGSQGVLPVREFMEGARAYFNQEQPGIGRYYLLPTWCWLGSSDPFLHGLCGGGVALSALLMLGVAPAVCALLLWTVYLSLTVVGGDFLSFQWDVLLLETGFLAVWLAPLQWLSLPGRGPPVARWPFWLLKWLLFRLMLESGCVKLVSGDPTWRNLTALKYHYETQPLPTWIGWYAHQGPAWSHAFCLWLLFGIELVLPFFVFGPRRSRLTACAGFVLLQTGILLTGNYGFFNYLTILLSLLLLDDQALARFVPNRWRKPITRLHTTGSTAENRVSVASASAGRQGPGRAWPNWIVAPIGVLILVVTLTQLFGMFGWEIPGTTLARWIAPFRSANTYGLFAVMTTTRPEIVIEGSNDRQTWRPYWFRYKPGPLDRRPRFVAPYQPRLDWQMWFAALGTYRDNRWFVRFCRRLLQGSAPVLALLEENPFPDEPPRYVRAMLYEYHFTDSKTRRQTGDWWRREPQGQYLPPVSLRDFGPPGPGSTETRP